MFCEVLVFPTKISLFFRNSKRMLNIREIQAISRNIHLSFCGTDDKILMNLFLFFICFCCCNCVIAVLVALRLLCLQLIMLTYCRHHHYQVVGLFIYVRLLIDYVVVLIQKKKKKSTKNKTKTRRNKAIEIICKRRAPHTDSTCKHSLPISRTFYKCE